MAATPVTATVPTIGTGPVDAGILATSTLQIPRDSTSTGSSSQSTLKIYERLGRRRQSSWKRSKRSDGKNVAGSTDGSPGSDDTDLQDAEFVTPSRPKTMWRAMHKLCTLSKEEVDAFMDSYVIYSLDWKDEDAMRRELGDNFQQRVGECLRAYYGVLNYLCALGSVEKMYIPPLMDKKLSVLDNQRRYEETIARDIGLKAGDHVLDLGCGRGRVAAHMAGLVPGAQVTGLNIDPQQVAQARSFNHEKGLPNKFVEFDFNDLPLPFEDNSFDGFYQIQALSLCRNHAALFKELNRVLKPGARVSILDWVSLPAYDASNPEHAELMRHVKPLIGAVGTPTPESFESDLKAAGFSVVKSDIPSVDGLQAPLIDKVDIYFRSLRQLILALVGVKILPPHLKTLINRLCLDGQDFVKMDNMRLITTTYRIIAQKPISEEKAVEKKEEDTKKDAKEETKEGTEEQKPVEKSAPAPEDPKSEPEHPVQEKQS